VYPLGYTFVGAGHRKTQAFAEWIDGLRDVRGRARVQARIGRLYFTRRGREIVVLLAGGDKSTQSKDIKTALQLARAL